MNPRRIPLLWKIWLSTSVALTALFALLGFLVLRSVQNEAAASLLREAQGSAKAYQAIWDARAEQLQSLAAMVGELPVSPALLENPGFWSRMHSELRGPSFLFVVDPNGKVRQRYPPHGAPQLDLGVLLESAQKTFPQPLTGFLTATSVLYRVVLTPLYDGSSEHNARTGVLVGGFAINHAVARELKARSGSSECIFLARGQIFGSTLDDHATGNVARHLGRAAAGSVVSDGKLEYVPFEQVLEGLDGAPVARLWILRPFAEARRSLALVRQRILLLWGAAIVAGLILTYAAVSRLLKPIRDLDAAASEVAMQNYGHRLAEDRDDELGRLATTFNRMCESLQAARAELVRRERVALIGRLTSSIVHDLRNPLAAIYGGCELLAETQPSPEHTRRITGNILRASRRVQEMLEDLTRVGKGQKSETASDPHPLEEVVSGAVARLSDAAESHGVAIRQRIPPHITLVGTRTRLEGVFVNLIQNALDVMPQGGEVRVDAATEGNWVIVEVTDTGPGVPQEVRDQLFQPFVSHGKRNGLGLGLALARQTAVDHGGDLWLSTDTARGARFLVRLPRQRSAG